MRRIVHYGQVSLEKWPFLAIVFFIFIVFLPVVFLYGLNTFVQETIVDRRDFIDNVSIDDVRLSVDSSDQFQHLKAIDNGMTGLGLDLETIMESFHYELVDLVEKNMPTEKSCF